MRRVALLIFLIISPSISFAEETLEIPLENDTGAKISLSSCFDPLPSCGYVPIVVTITNDSSRRRAWTFLFQSPVFVYRASSMTFTATEEVPPMSTRNFNLLVPLSLYAKNSYTVPLSVSVLGPGSVGVSLQIPSRARRMGKPVSAFVAISDSLASASLSQLEKALTAKGVDLAASRFDPSKLPEDWRALIGITGLWLTKAELASLSASQRAALQDWVLRGGALFIIGSGELDNQFRTTGFGRATFVPGSLIDVDRTTQTIRDLEKDTVEYHLTQSYGYDWKAVKKVGTIKPRALLLVAFMAVFAVVVGPLNLYVFAGRNRRHRLFWTTPLISVAASGLLFLVIIMQDGFGGSGTRVALVYVAPDEKRSVVLQEQLARTGALLGSSFHVRDPSFIAPITLGTPPSPPAKRYENSGTSFSGEWFVSRSLQPHWIECVTPSRAGLALANATEARNSGAAPIVVSSINGILDDVFFRDERGGTWSAHAVKTGERVTLRAESAAVPELLPPEAGSRLRAMWSRLNEEKNCIYATARESEDLVATLPSIHWKDDHVLYIAPLLVEPDKR